MSAIPKPVTTRMPYAIKQTMHKTAVHGQQIINIQTQLAALSAAASSAPVSSAPSAYTDTWGTEVVTAINALISALQAQS
jgi:hypothetical protein